jgi:parallel beta-helix repeat protein
MSLQDFRGQGPPEDIGTFQMPCNVLVFKHVFSGTTYTCAVRSGERGWVLVDFGTNDSTVTQSAINAGPGLKFIKAGTYLVADINLTSNIELSGEGSGTVLKLPDMTRKNILNIVNVSNVVVSNLMLDGNWANQDMTNWSMKVTGGPADTIEILLNNIYAYNSSQITVKDVYTVNAVNNGLLFYDGVVDSLVQNVYVYGTQWHGIEFWAGGRRSAIIGCVGHDTYLSPFVIEYGDPSDEHSIIANCIAYDSTGTNISLNSGIQVSSPEVVVEGNTVYNAKIWVQGSNCVIANNNVYVNNVTHGIWIDGGTQNLIIGNRIYQPLYDGIRIGGNDNTIMGNLVSDGGAYSNAIDLVGNARNIVCYNRIVNWAYGTAAILEQTGADYNDIFGNVFVNVTVSKIVKVGANTRVKFNQGFKTENSGSATISASTSVNVTHGLAGTPTVVTVTPRSTGYGSFAVTARTSTTFTITVTTSGTYTFDWYAEYTP